MNGRNFAHGVDFGTSGWYKARIRGGAKWLILLWLQERTDNPFLGTMPMPMNSLNLGAFDPVAGTQNRGPAFSAYQMATHHASNRFVPSPVSSANARQYPGRGRDGQTHSVGHPGRRSEPSASGRRASQ